MVEKAKVLALIGFITLFGNWVGYGISPRESITGIILIVIITVVGLLVNTRLPKIPAVIWISLIALIITTPAFPGSEWIVAKTEVIDFMALATPILAYAGLSLGKDLNSFKKLGWRIVVISLVVYTGTFFFAAMFAEIIFQLQGRF